MGGSMDGPVRGSSGKSNLTFEKSKLAIVQEPDDRSGHAGNAEIWVGAIFVALLFVPVFVGLYKTIQIKLGALAGLLACVAILSLLVYIFHRFVIKSR